MAGDQARRVQRQGAAQDCDGGVAGEIGVARGDGDLWRGDPLAGLVHGDARAQLSGPAAIGLLTLGERIQRRFNGGVPARDRQRHGAFTVVPGVPHAGLDPGDGPVTRLQRLDAVRARGDVHAEGQGARAHAASLSK